MYFPITLRIHKTGVILIFLSLVFVKKPYSDKVLLHLSQLEEENYSFGAASVFCHLFLFFPSSVVMVVDEDMPGEVPRDSWLIGLLISVQSCVVDPGFSFSRA